MGNFMGKGFNFRIIEGLVGDFLEALARPLLEVKRMEVQKQMIEKKMLIDKEIKLEILNTIQILGKYEKLTDPMFEKLIKEYQTQTLLK